jgi:sterol desaturase/sphingolipid hydroxylase (fatty acid hydroxylase superfamily)
LESLLYEYEAAFRLGVFALVFALMALWEIRAPRRPLSVSKPARWLNNLGLVALNTLVLRLLFPAAAVGMAFYAEAHQWGLLNLLPLPFAVELLLSVIILDLVIWTQHLVVHKFPLLWKLHRVHHADLDYDLTTGLRFHPIEIILSMLIKFAAIALLGPPALAVLLFEAILNGMAVFNHANVSLPPRLDRLLRRVVVTPDMHRVHHSIERDETDSNYGFNLSLWDRLFGTYRDQPRAGHDRMTIGIPSVREPGIANRLPGMLALPFRRTPG